MLIIGYFLVLPIPQSLLSHGHFSVIPFPHSHSFPPQSLLSTVISFPQSLLSHSLSFPQSFISHSHSFPTVSPLPTVIPFPTVSPFHSHSFPIKKLIWFIIVSFVYLWNNKTIVTTFHESFRTKCSMHSLLCTSTSTCQFRS